MADTMIVGRVAIRVLPDTDGFKERLKKDLKKETESVDATVPVEAKVQTEKMEQDLRAKAKEMSDRFEIKLKTQIDDLRARVSSLTKQAEAQSKSDPITLQADVDADSLKGFRAGMLEAIKRSVARDLNAAFRKGMKMDPQTLRLLSDQIQGHLAGTPLKPNVDTSKAKRDIKDDLGDALQDSMQKAITTGLTRGFDDFRRHFEAGNEGVKVHVNPDFAGTAGASDQIKSDWDRAMRINAANSSRQFVGAYENGFRQSLSRSMFRIKAKLKTLLRDTKVAVKTDLDEKSVIDTSIGLEILFKRFKVFTSKVKVALDKKSVAAVRTGIAALSGGRLFKKLVSLEPFKDLDTQLPKIAIMSTLLGQAANYLLAMSSDALSLLRSLGYIAPAALALPGIFLAAGASLYAVITPLKEFNKRLPAMGVGLKAMQASMVDSFWVKARKGMSTLTRLLPGLSGGFKLLGAEAGTFMGALTSSVVTKLGPKLKPFFAAVGGAFRDMTKAAGPLGRTFAIFTELGTHYMPRLGKATAAVAIQFSRWLDKSMKSGDLLAWIDRGIENIKALGGVTAGVYRIFEGLSRAAEAAGGATLQGLAASLERIQRTIKTPEFQSGLTNVFRSARVAIEEMTRIAGPAVTAMFSNIGKSAHLLLPIVGQVAGRLARSLAEILNQPAVGDGLVAFFSSLNQALETLRPSLKNVGKGLGGILRVLGTMVTSFTPIVEISLSALENHVNGLLSTVESIIRSLSVGLANFMRSIMPSIEKLAPAVLNIADAVGGTLGNAFTILGPAIGVLLGGIANLLTVFSKMPGIIQTAVLAFVLLNSKMGASLALGLAPLVTHLKSAGVAIGDFAKRSGVAGPKVQAFGARVAGSTKTLGKFALKAGATGLAIGAMAASFGAGTTAGVELELALQKVNSADFSHLYVALGKVNKGMFGFGGYGGDIDEFARSLKILADTKPTQGFDDFMNSLSSIFTGGALKSTSGRIRDQFAEIDGMLASLSTTDAQKAADTFERIRERAVALGTPVAELEALFPKYQATVSLAAGKAAGDFTKSTTEMKAEAAALRTAIDTAFSKMDDRINALRGKARSAAISDISKARADMLKGLLSTTTGLDKKMVEQAIGLNTKISETVAKLGRTKDEGARKGLKEKLDGLLAEYRERFSNLPGLIEETAGEFDPSGLLAGVGTGAGIGKGVGKIKAQITAAFAGAKVAAQVGSGELKRTLATATTGLTLGGSVGSKLGSQVRRAFEMAKVAAQIGSAQLRAALATATTGLKVGGNVGSQLATQVSRSYALAKVAAQIGSAQLKASITAASKGVFSGATAGMSGYVKAFRSKAAEPPKVAKAMAAKVKAAAQVGLTQAGANVGNSYVRGLRSTIGAAIAAARAIGKATKDNKGPESYDKRMLTPAGVWVVQGFVRGLRSQIPLVENTMQEITKIVAGTDMGSAINRAASSASQITALTSLSLGTTQTVNQIGDVTVDIKDLEGIKTLDELAKTLRRKKRQAGGR